MRIILTISVILLSLLFTSCSSTIGSKKVDAKVEATISAFQTQTATTNELINQVKTQAVSTYISQQLANTPTKTETPLPIISAMEGWQSTRISLDKGNTLSISVIDGTWTQWKGTVAYNTGNGWEEYTCALAMDANKCGEPLPTSPSGALICKIGDQIFEVGNKTTITATEDGLLSCRINDGDDGLLDNDGELTLSIDIVKK